MNILQESPFKNFPTSTSTEIADLWRHRASYEHDLEINSARDRLQLALSLNHRAESPIPSDYDSLELALECPDPDTINVCLWFSLYEKRLGFITLVKWSRLESQRSMGWN